MLNEILARRVLIVLGKGGVGKSTLSAAIAKLATFSGARALIMECDGRAPLAATFGVHPEVSLAYSLVRRARDWTLGVPALIRRALADLLDVIHVVVDHARPGRQRILVSGQPGPDRKSALGGEMCRLAGPKLRAEIEQALLELENTDIER